jgi:AMP nucleosidase
MRPELSGNSLSRIRRAITLTIGWISGIQKVRAAECYAEAAAVHGVVNWISIGCSQMGYGGMKTKDEITKDWLPRYTGVPLKDFGEYILLTNFSSYVQDFAQRYKVEVMGQGKPMQSATANGITIIDFGMGSAMAATVMDLLSAIRPKALLFLGKCGGLKKKIQIGDVILPIAAIRGEGTSNDYLPIEVPALPSFHLQQAISNTVKKYELSYWTGTIYTTNRRVWEHDKEFRRYLTKIRAAGIDMETATIFLVGFTNEIPRGALLLVSDNPMVPEGIKTEKSDQRTNKLFAKKHLSIGIDSLTELINTGEPVKHLRY